MYVYADQNFLIKCRDNQEVKELVVAAHKSEKATLVLSPIHFYEIGTVRQDLYELTVQFVEGLQPAWILGRADLQLQEFLSEWNRFWRRPEFIFSAIGDLMHVASAINRRPREVFTGLTVRDFIEPFRANVTPQDLLDTTDLLDEVFKDNKFANSVNQARYKAGEITLRMLREIDKRYVAAQLARAHDEAQTPRELFDKANRIFQSEPSFTEISIFAENGGVSKLRAHTVETQMTYNSWAGDATLKENSQIDREHAVVSLAYCDVFVTSDPKLTKYCEKAKAASKLQLASVVDHDLWIEALRKM